MAEEIKARLRENELLDFLTKNKELLGART